MWIIFAMAVVLGQALLVHGQNPEACVNCQETLAKLKNKLAEKRDPLVRPDLGATSVNITLGIKHVSLVEMYSTIIVSAWVRLEWTDKRLAWDAEEEFKSIKTMHHPSGLAWQPDIVLKNSLAGKAATLVDRSAPLTLSADGRVTWTPSAQLEAYCELDLRRWPFERHACTLSFGSWTLDRTQLTIDEYHSKLEFPGQTGEFIVDGVDMEFGNTVEPGIGGSGDGRVYDQVNFLFRLHREPGTYRAVIFTPAAVVIILCLCTFWLPPRAGEKVVLGGVNAMLICLFLIFFAHSLPVLTDQTPLIVVFYTSSLYLVSFSLVASVLVLNLARQSHASKLPWPIKSFLTGPCGRVLLLNSYIEQMMGVDNGPCPGRGRAGVRRQQQDRQDEMPVVQHEEMTESFTFGQGRDEVAPRGESVDAASPSGGIACRRVSPNLDWLLLAAAIDRVLFVVYSLLFICLAIAFHV